MEGLPVAISGGTELFREQLHEALSTASDQAAANIQSTGDASRQLIEELLGGLDASIQALTKASLESSIELKNAASGITEGVQLLTDSMQSSSEEAASKMIEGAERFGESATDGANQAIAAFSTGADVFKSTVIESALESSIELKNAASGITEGVQLLTDSMQSSSEEAASKMIEGAERFGESATEGANRAIAAFSTGADVFKTTVIESAQQAAENAGQRIEEGAEQAIDKIADNLSEPLSDLKNSANSFSSDINVLGDRVELLSNSTSTLTGVTQELGNSLADTLGQLKSVVSESDQIMSALQEATKPLPDTINALLEENVKRQEQYGKFIADIRGFNELTTQQSTELKDVWSAHETRFQAIDEGLTKAFIALDEQIKQYVQESQAATRGMSDHFIKSVDMLEGAISEFGEIVIEHNASKEPT